jgi:hypothetical protein
MDEIKRGIKKQRLENSSLFYGIIDMEVII